MSADTEKVGIPVGSGYIYETIFDGSTIPADEDIEIEANRLGHIEKGATLTYKPTFKTFKDDMGKVARNVLTDEEATLKLGLISWVYSKLSALCSTCRVTEKDGGRTIKIGGIANDDGKQHLFRFVHPDKLLGDVRITIVGTNTGGLSLAYAPDSSTNIEPEITAEPSDDEGTLVLLDIEDHVLGVLTVTSAAGSTSGKTKITVTPALTSGDSYMYKTAATEILPTLGDICDTETGYTVWDGSADITATTGDKILIAEVDNSYKAVKAGIATVASMA